MILLELSCSVSDLDVSSESISSMKTTDGWWTLATANSARTIFSPSPTHFDVRVDALIEKNVELI